MKFFLTFARVSQRVIFAICLLLRVFFFESVEKKFSSVSVGEEKKKTKFTKYNFGETILSWGRLSRLETASASFVHNKLQWLA